MSLLLLISRSCICMLMTAGAILAMACCVGCGTTGPAIAPVNGKVLIDGKPLTQGRVVAVPAAGRGANGIIQPDGSFTLSTYEPGDGALVGTHKISVVAYAGAGAGGPESSLGNLIVPRRYINPETSGLTIDVTADGENSPLIELITP